MTQFVHDFSLVSALMAGFIVAFLGGAIILARIALGVRDFLNRNN